MTAQNARLHAVVLDAATLGDDISFRAIEEAAELTLYPITAPEEVAARIADADVVILNKIRLCEENLQNAARLRLICVAATGYDNIDTEYCRRRGIAVCNVLGYSTHSVAQLTVALALERMMRLPAYTSFVADGSYSASGRANRIEPPFHELCGKTWGILGAGNIGTQVARIAAAFGCRVLVCRRRQDPVYPTVDVDTLCAESDILSIHTPLTAETRGMISRERIAKMKDGAVLINVGRGAVTDEAAVAEAVLSGKLGGLGCDVYADEPLRADHPYYPIRNHPAVSLTPHMAWGAIEARQRCMDEIGANIRAFAAGERRCRVV